MRVEGDNHVLIFRCDMGPMQCTGVAARALVSNRICALTCR
ncbi:hypothetical protein XOCgx_0209 [Xanthomonas oryzae pv. oryzicola]|nr:hypothetical protein XOCgx_0209 [Xanthomonas oryzae pv. oryzicola]